MKKFALSVILLMFICLPGSTAHAQNTANIDSLLKVLKTSRPDTNKIKTLDEIASVYIHENKLQQALLYSNRALELSTKLKSRPLEAKCLYRTGSIHARLYAYAKALHYFNRNYLGIALGS